MAKPNATKLLSGEMIKICVKVCDSINKDVIFKWLDQNEAGCQNIRVPGFLLEESNHRKMDANSSAKYTSYVSAFVVSGIRQVESKKCENVSHTHTHTHTDVYIFNVKEVKVWACYTKVLTHYDRHILAKWRFIYFYGLYSH